MKVQPYKHILVLAELQVERFGEQVVSMAGLPPPGYGQQHHGVSGYPTQVVDLHYPIIITRQ